jgi:lipopolysaccharide biosynthesis glycosyltransferase
MSGSIAMQPRKTTSRPAQSSRAVVFCVDKTYFPYAIFAASQLAHTSRHSDFDIVVCAPEGMSVPDTLSDLKIRLATIATDGMFDGLYIDERRTEAVYHRLVLPEVFADEYERLLYLDADIFIHGGGLVSLFDVNLGGHALAAVRDNQQWTKPSRHMADFANMGIGPEKYFNSGVLLIDVATFRSQKILERCIAYGRENNDKLRQHDQELLNCVLKGDWAELSPIWNWQQPVRSAYFEVMVPVAITHFIGPRKPWNDIEGKLPPRFAIAFRAFLNLHFPEMDEIKVLKASDVSAAYIARLTIKNILRARQLRRYLRRFPDDMLAEE